MRRYAVLTVALCSIVSFLVGVVVAGGVLPVPGMAPVHAVGTVREQVRRPATTASPAAGAVNFADVADRINAAVVNIDSATRGGRDPRRRRSSDDATGAPRDLDLPHQGSGSGFVIDRQGFILTNFHVIEDADRITVTLADGRVLRGDVVGTDPAIDVALIKVAGGGALPEAPLGNSDELRVGEWVCAIGNPLGYVHSVTVGVVSFIGRKLFDASLDDYIQTDAAINLGNSGGPLINARGEVIGINSAISSRANNIGFAVPINQGGALVQDVSAGSPAERAGLKPYDVILTVDGREIWTNEELIRDISGRQPGSVARLDVLRNGRHEFAVVRLVERPARDAQADAGGLPTKPAGATAPSDPALGLIVRDLDAAAAKRMDIPASVQGVIVVRVDPVGAAFVPAMRRGFVIMEINRRPVRSSVDFERLMAAARTGDALAFYGYDPAVGQHAFVMATVDAR